MTNIALYSDQPILGEGLRNVVGSLEGFALSAIYSSPDLMIDHIRRTECPDLLLVEVTPAMTLGALKQVRSVAPAAAIILWVGSVAPEYAMQALQLGVRGIILKNASLESHFECLRQVASGQLWIQKDVSNELLSLRQTKLTPRELQLMALMTQGLKNKEIAWQLKITEGTVKVYLSRLFQKVGARDRFDLALIALKNLTSDKVGVGRVHSAVGTGAALASFTPQTTDLACKTLLAPAAISQSLEHCLSHDEQIGVSRVIAKLVHESYSPIRRDQTQPLISARE